MHLVSDATGETVISSARACVAQFDGVKPIEHFWNLVRTQRQLNLVVEGIQEKPGIVIYTLVDRELRARIETACRELQLPCVPMLDPILKGLSAYLGLESKAQPGRQHTMGEEYFSRLDAMDFALNQDDGQAPSKLTDADVILVGVSRTSKTPTCIYLANRGIKAANVPYVPGTPLPEILTSGKAPMVVGLTEDPERLVSIRRNRLRMLNQDGLAGDRRDPALDRGNRGGNHQDPGAAEPGLRRGLALLTPQLVLASGSASRRAMLAAAGVDVVIDPPDLDEGAVKQSCRVKGFGTRKTAIVLAEAKAEAVQGRHPGRLVLAADQMLECDGEWFDKPVDRGSAARQIARLAGRAHRLVTAAVIVRDGLLRWRTIKSASMTVRPLTAQFIETYLDRAGDRVLSSVGGYEVEGLGVQLFSQIRGDHFTILGLPLLELLAYLRTEGVVPA
jgi:MAF protein